MDREIAIKAENISKHFAIAGGLKAKTLASMFSKKRAFRGMNEKERITDGNFWALRDINLEVYKGETLGIIGSNGAGKTTLLKIFSKILKQSQGNYSINGRVSSLIGVGTGFHQELTGRENVYFNGALLGMKKSEIDRRFEEIVEFAEVGSFVDSPIKFYSSGMRARLAFSVAMNLDAEIMIIDEALAVGDAAFRQKSSEKMRNTAFTGRTVMFVTHSMSFMQDVCDRSILLEAGKLVAEGPTTEVVDKYLSKGQNAAGHNWKTGKKKVGDNVVTFDSINLYIDGRASSAKSVSDTDTTEVAVKLKSSEDTSLYSVGYSLFDESGQKLWSTRSSNLKLDKGSNVLMSKLPIDLLRPGLYYIALDVSKRSEGWIVDPNKTKAKLMFSLSSDRPDMLEVQHEGIVKPRGSWKRV